MGVAMWSWVGVSRETKLQLVAVSTDVERFWQEDLLCVGSCASLGTAVVVHTKREPDPLDCVQLIRYPLDFTGAAY